MAHIEVTGTIETLTYQVWAGDPPRCLAIIPGQHHPCQAGWIARQMLEAVERWESYKAAQAAGKEV